MNDQKTSYGAKDKINVLQYNGFIFRQQSPILWGKNGSLYPALVGLTAGRQAGWQAGRRNMAGFWNLKNPLQVKLCGVYFIYGCAMLLIVL